MVSPGPNEGGVPADRVGAPPDEPHGQLAVQGLDLLEGAGELGLVPLDADAEPPRDRRQCLGDRAGIRILALEAGFPARGLPPGDPSARSVDRHRPDRHQPAADLAAARAGGDDLLDPGPRSQHDHEIGGAGVVDMAAERPPGADDELGGRVRPGHVLGAGEQPAEQQRSRGTLAMVVGDDEVAQADPADRPALELHPPDLGADEADHLPVVDGDQRRQLVVLPAVVERRGGQGVLGESEFAEVGTKQRHHRGKIRPLELSDLRHRG